MAVGRGGWVHWENHSDGRSAYLRFADRNGRLVIVELYLDVDAGINGDVLRAMQLGRLEAWANEPMTSKQILTRITEPGADLRTLAAHYATQPGRPGMHWAGDSYFAQIAGSGVPRAPIPRRRRSQPKAADEVDATIDGAEKWTRKGDDFYKRVAEVYAALLRGGAKNPAGIIADANGIAGTHTVHAWVKEARRRGHLGTGQRGKVN